MHASMCSVFKSLTKTIDTMYFPGECNWLSYFSAASFLFISYVQCSIGLSHFRILFLSKAFPYRKVNLDSCVFLDCAEISACLLQADHSINHILCLSLTKVCENLIQSSRKLFH